MPVANEGKKLYFFTNIIFFLYKENKKNPMATIKNLKQSAEKGSL